MEIKDLRSTVVSLYQMDDIDFMSISTIPALTQIQNTFGVTVNPVQQPGANISLLLFYSGKVEIKDTQIIIDKISIEPRKIVLTIGGNSEQADIILDELLSIISRLETRRAIRQIKPIIKVYESACSFISEKIISDLLAKSTCGTIPNYIKGNIPSPTDEIDFQIEPIEVKYMIRYNISNKEILNNRINLNDKFISIAVRDGTLSTRQNLYISGPLKSNDLIDLIIYLENKKQQKVLSSMTTDENK